MNFKIFRYLSLLIYFLLFSYLPVISQDKREPTSRTINIDNPIIQKDSLPKINLPEFVITGKEKIDLPNENKIETLENKIFIPLLSKVFTQVIRDYSTAEIETPSKNSSIFGIEKQNFLGFLKVGYGRFSSPLLEFGIFPNLPENSIGLLGGYDASNVGYVPDAEYKKGFAQLSFGSVLRDYDNIFNSTKINLKLNYFGEKFKFYGMRSVFFDSYQRSINKSSFDFSISSEKILPLDYNFSISATNYKCQTIIPTNARFSYPFSEIKYIFQDNSIETNLNLISYFGYWKFYGQLMFSYNHIDRNENNNSSQKFSEISLGTKTGIIPNMDIDLNFALFMYRNMNDVDKYRFFPRLMIHYYLNNNITFFAGFQPSVYQMSFDAAQSKFKYIDDLVSIRHLINPLDINIGTELNFENFLRITLNLNYYEQLNTPILYSIYSYEWESFIASPSEQVPYFNLCFKDTKSSNYTGDVNISYNFSEETDIAFNFKVLQSKINDNKVPYTPNMVMIANIAHKFPFGLTLEPKFLYIGSRFVSSNEDVIGGKIDRYIDPYLVFNINCEYQILERLKVFLYLSNILDKKYYTYESYLAVPFMITAGLNYKL